MRVSATPQGTAGTEACYLPDHGGNQQVVGIAETRLVEEDTSQALQQPKASGYHGDAHAQPPQNAPTLAADQRLLQSRPHERGSAAGDEVKAVAKIQDEMLDPKNTD